VVGDKKEVEDRLQEVSYGLGYQTWFRKEVRNRLKGELKNVSKSGATKTLTGNKPA